MTNRGAITATTLYVSSIYSPASTSFNVNANDSIGTMSQYGVDTTFAPGAVIPTVYSYDGISRGSSVTTSATGNVTKYLYCDPNSTIDWRPATTCRTLWMFAVRSMPTATMSKAGPSSSATTTARRRSTTSAGWPLTPTTKAIATQVTLPVPGSTINTMYLTGNSTMTVYDAVGQIAGLTLSGENTSDLTIDPGSDLAFQIEGQAAPGGWVLHGPTRATAAIISAICKT